MHLWFLRAVWSVNLAAYISHWNGFSPCAVGALMHFEVVRIGKSTLTHLTLEGPFSCVGALMPFEVGRPGESSITHLTLKWFFSCVDALMSCEVVWPGKSTLTHVTVKWLFSHVGALMACEGGTFGESSLDTRTGKCFLTLPTLGFWYFLFPFSLTLLQTVGMAHNFVQWSLPCMRPQTSGVSGGWRTLMVNKKCMPTM